MTRKAGCGGEPGKPGCLGVHVWDDPTPPGGKREEAEWCTGCHQCAPCPQCEGGKRVYRRRISSSQDFMPPGKCTACHGTGTAAREEEK